MPVDDMNQDENLIDTVWRRFKAAEQMPSAENIGRLASCFTEALSRYAYSGDRTTRLSMAQLTLNITALRINQGVKNRLFFNDVATFFNLTALNEMPERLVQQKELWPMLATFCLFSACHDENYAPDNTTDRVATYMTLMLGRKVSVHEAFSKELLADLLYGPAVWDLYRSDVLLDEDMPLYLLKQNVPLRCLSSPEQSCEVAVDLPKELY